jgi:succinyl-diaminopimelate desuccinylase
VYLLKKLNAKIHEIVEHRAKELTKLCCQLVQAKGENPPGDVTEVAHAIEDFLETEGINYQTFEPAKGHVSVVATLGQGKPSLILCGHIDVVPAGDPSKWDVHPYESSIKHDKILGRGTTDQKSGVAAMLMAIAALKGFEENLAGKVTVASVSDEEAPGPGGTRWLLKNKKLNGNACLITEPTGHLNDKYSIVGGERGNCWLSITAYGKPAHGSTPVLGRNAIHMLIEFLPKLKALEGSAVRVPKDAETLIQNGRKQLRKTAEKQSVPAGNLTRALNHYTTNLGLINGGTKVNIVPEKCAAEVDIRVPAGGNPDAVEEFVRSVMPENLECKVINKALPSFTPATHPLTKVVQQSAKRVLGYMPSATYMAATSDAHHFREILGVPTVSFGPGYDELAHVFNEFVYVKDVLNMAKVYADVTLNLST